MGAIRIHGAKTHNLQNISLEIPKHKLVGIAGVSGAGKSSLVFTLAAGAEQAVASLFPPFLQARMANLAPGDVDCLEGLTFTAIVSQKKFNKNVRSSVGTAIGVAPYLRLLFSRAASPRAGFSPSYSPNDIRGMCTTCSGLGYIDDIDLDELIDRNRSLREGAIRFPSFQPEKYRWKRLVCSGIADPDRPWKDLTREAKELLLYGKGVPLTNPLPGYPKHGMFDGVIPRLKASYLEKAGAKLTKEESAELMRIVKKAVCPTCQGLRINSAARASKLNGLNIAEASHLSIAEFLKYMERIRGEVIEGSKQNILTRCKYLCRIGLDYISLDRPTDSLSGGEAQRLRIVGLLSTPITDATFIMDEPSSGLHPADIERVLRSLKQLRDAGNTVVIVEHNLQILTECDYVIELGPGAGEAGGQIVFAGSPDGLIKRNTPTGRARRSFVVPNHKMIETVEILSIKNATFRNLKNVSVSFPTKALTVISGVAGSGKSSLVSVLAKENAGVAMVDQLPLMATGRSSLLTVLDLAEPVRGLFANVSGLDPSYFSSNGKGACPECKGRGVIRVDMAFMNDVTTVCEKCGGKKFNNIALSYKLPLKDGEFTIAEILDSSWYEIKERFSEQSEIRTVASLFQAVGLSYLKLGQTLNTLSGGELNRVKLVKFLKKHSEDASRVLVLDEITTGLHPEDVKSLIDFFRQLTSKGFTVIAVDHNLELISRADYNVDMGPGAGERGGNVVFCGTAQGLSSCRDSETGKWLLRFIENKNKVGVVM